MSIILNGAAHIRQRSIYLLGILGHSPKIPVSLEELENAARKVLPKKTLAIIDGGAGYEKIYIENNRAFKKWSIVQRVLTDTWECNSSVNLFGQEHSYPFMIAPIGINEIFNKQAEPAAAKAAASEDIAMIFSTQASTPMEKVAAVMGDSKRWYQLYMQNDEINKSLIKRAEACGCSAIVVTVDTNPYGWRTGELSLGHQPFFHKFKGLAQYSSDPVFLKLLEEHMNSKPESVVSGINFTLIKNIITMAWNFPGSFWSNLITRRPVYAINLITSLWSSESFSWEGIVKLRKLTKLPILIKGIQHPDDARLAVKHGFDGIIVSNHGGRQLSGGITTIDALPAIAEAVESKIPILLDSGIRGGADIFKAIALGANAVLIGRPYLFALTLAGEEGVKELLQNLKAEFDITMALTGCATVKDITKDKIQKLS